LVLAAADSRGLYLLNSSAAFIWDKLRLGWAPDEIRSGLAEAYRLSSDHAQRDVNATLLQWDDLFNRKRPEPLSPDVAVVELAGRMATTYSWNHVTFSVCVDSDELAAEIYPRLRGLESRNSEPRFTFYLVTHEAGIQIHLVSEPGHAELIACEDTVSAARAILLQEIIRRANGHLEWLSVLHAGACGNESKCVIFPAASHSGKSTLAAVLMQRGLAFYADDSVPVEKGTLQVPCMPFGLAIREGSWPLIGERFPGFHDSAVWTRFGERVRFLYPSPHNMPARAVAIVFTAYQQQAAFSIRRLNTLETLLGLQQSGFWVDPQRESIQAFLDWLQSIPSYELTYDDVDLASEFIEAFVGLPPHGEVMPASSPSAWIACQTSLSL
jgi:hypothetical protein